VSATLKTDGDLDVKDAITALLFTAAALADRCGVDRRRFLETAGMAFQHADEVVPAALADKPN
jgi:hypothetical protein